jgi:hypothetical protein
MIKIKITLFSLLLAFFFSHYTQENHTFKASTLPSQIGEIKESNRYIKNSTKKGFLSYGPYLQLTNGRYSFSINYTSKKAEGITYDIVTKGQILVKGKLPQNSTHFQKNIEIKTSTPVEVRVWYNGIGELTLHSIIIKKEPNFKNIIWYLLILLLINFSLFYLYQYSKTITLFLLLLISLIALFFILDAYQNFNKYRKLTYKEMPLTNNIFFYYLKQSLKTEYINLTAPPLKKNRNHQIEKFHIMIGKKELNSLNSNLPLSGISHFVNAKIKINNQKSKQIKLRYRGGSAWNWSYRRKSIKIKFGSNDSYNMMKKINFSVLYSLDMYMEAITQKIAIEMGALAPEVKIVEIFINGKYEGLYLYLDQIDESFLRKNRLMPGSIYYGDYSLKVNPLSYKGRNGIAKLWYENKVWEKKASRNREQRTNRKDIELFIEAINNHDPQKFYEFAETFLSKEYYTYLALDVLWGTHHHDYFHNHKIYFDPYRGKFTPISWDIRFWRDNTIKDNSYYPLVEKIALNPLLEYKRDKELYRILQTVTPNKIKKLIEKQKFKFKNAFQADRKRKKIAINQKLFPWKETHNLPQLLPATEKDLEHIYQTYLKNFTNRVTYLQKMLNATKVKYAVEEEGNSTTITLSIDGNSPVKLKYKNSIIFSGRAIQAKNALGLNLSDYGKTHLKSTPQYYTFKIPTNNFNEKLFNSGVNAITGKEVIFEKVKKIVAKPTDSIHPNKLIKSITKNIILEGEIEVKENLIFDKKTTITIKPNTTFILYPKKSIYFYGKVIAIGTKKYPIKFIAKDSSKPWGVITLQGQATSHSRFYYCSFNHGSVASKNLISYTAQFNIHDTTDFEIKSCTIGQNYIGDDAMHIAYSQGTVENSSFKGARSDALDIDISTVTINQNSFTNSGNDALDIMTSTMIANGNSFLNSGDKGISVGEWSTATISNSIFEKNHIGLEIKDQSIVEASNLTFINSKVKDINLYNKNKRYSQGGFLKGLNLNFKTISIDKKSKFIKDKIP